MKYRSGPFELMDRVILIWISLVMETVVQSKRGKQHIVNNGYVHRCYRTVTDFKYYRCIKLKCKSGYLRNGSHDRSNRRRSRIEHRNGRRHRASRSAPEVYQRQSFQRVGWTLGSGQHSEYKYFPRTELQIFSTVPLEIMQLLYILTCWSLSFWITET